MILVSGCNTPGICRIVHMRYVNASSLPRYLDHAADRQRGVFLCCVDTL